MAGGRDRQIGGIMSKAIVNGIEVHYEVDGSGPWLTLAHALACDLSLWDEFTAALRDRFTILRYDLRGHGASGAPPGPYDFSLFTHDLIGLLDHLKIERTDFLGVSLGGMEEGLFPHDNAIAEPQGLEEERRLMYVAVTRARRRLYLSMAQMRMLHGQTRFPLPSRFLDEIPAELLKWLTPRRQGQGGYRR
ncbi:MAG TPA: alpha/beta fold hydrolase, partial [Rhodocyclaceae bacterium]|nr:alpha/beta fold hydrolase [Rhodocyclaceae bacterium]